MPNSSSTPTDVLITPEPKALTRAQARRIGWAVAIGNGLVVYDFTVYSFAAVIIGNLFFPSHSPLASLLMSLLTFGAGFIMRPVGAVVLGHLADRRGRRIGLLLSITAMTLGTGIIAFAPTYESVGPLAMGLIVIARLLQGFAAGGEIGVASVVLMELAPRKQRCYIVSWRAFSQAAAALVGALVGACLAHFLTQQELEDWGWRIPFVLGMLIGPVGWYIRRRLVETAPSGTHRPTPSQLLAQHPRALLYGILSIAAPTSSIYLMVFYMPTYLVGTLHMPHNIGLLSACLSSLMLFLVTPFMARLADRLPTRKPTQFVTMTSCIVLVYPMFMVLTQDIGELASLALIGAYVGLALGNNAATTVMMLEAFPRHHRATGMSIIYSFGGTIFGGFCPFIVTWLISVTGNPMAPAWYLLTALCISLFALVNFPGPVEETR